MNSIILHKAKIYRLSLLLVFLMLFIGFYKAQDNIHLTFEQGESPEVELSNYTNSIKKGIAKTGQSSLFLSNNTEFGTTLLIKRPLKKWVKVSVWKKGDGGALVASAKDYYKSSYLVKSTNGGWEYLEAYFMLPYGVSDLKIYLYNNLKSSIYFDDFMVEWMDNYPYPELSELVNIDIEVDDNFLFNKLEEQAEANKAGRILNSMKEWEPLNFKFNDEIIKGKMRLKGDWLDHFSNDKWSWRIKLEKEGLLGKKIFSIQQPGTRGYLKEWLLHNIAKEEGLLTTQYSFVNLTLNGSSKGCYAFEEHFTDELLIHQNKEITPVYKFNERSFWDMVAYDNHNDKRSYQKYYLFKVANIETFGEKKIFKNKIQTTYFIEGVSILNSLRNLDTSSYSSINLEQFAKYLALTDVFQNYHSLHWINMRFYYDPTTRKVEPIVYDGYEDHPSKPFKSTPIIGYVDAEHDTVYNLEQMFVLQLFSIPEFATAYYKYLNKYASKSFFDNIYTKYDERIQELTAVLKKEYSWYSFEWNFYYQRSDEIRRTLKSNQDNLLLDGRAIAYVNFYNWLDMHKDDVNLPSFSRGSWFENIGIKAFYKNDSLFVVNHHPNNVTINTVLDEHGKPLDFSPLELGAYNPADKIKVVRLPIQGVYRLIVGTNDGSQEIEVTKYQYVNIDEN